MDESVHFVVQLAKEAKDIVKVLAVDVRSTPSNRGRSHAVIVRAHTCWKIAKSDVVYVCSRFDSRLQGNDRT
jgi:uncharacterized protein YgbK (DUF1537 family)